MVTHLNDNINHKYWAIEAYTYTNLFGRIVNDILLINHTLEKLGIKNEEFVPIQDYINPNRLPLPNKKTDLKILYLDANLRPIKDKEITSRIAEELQLNITFEEDNNSGLGKYVQNHLGDYDIIIVSRMYSGNLLKMNYESKEQCKDTGRDLTLLVSYDNDSLQQFNDDKSLGFEIGLKYKFAGNFTPVLIFIVKNLEF